MVEVKVTYDNIERGTLYSNDRGISSGFFTLNWVRRFKKYFIKMTEEIIQDILFLNGQDD